MIFLIINWCSKLAIGLGLIFSIYMFFNNRFIGVGIGLLSFGIIFTAITNAQAEEEEQVKSGKIKRTKEQARATYKKWLKWVLYYFISWFIAGCLLKEWDRFFIRENWHGVIWGGAILAIIPLWLIFVYKNIMFIAFLLNTCLALAALLLANLSTFTIYYSITLFSKMNFWEFEPWKMIVIFPIVFFLYLYLYVFKKIKLLPAGRLLCQYTNFGKKYYWNEHVGMINLRHISITELKNPKQNRNIHGNERFPLSRWDEHVLYCEKDFFSMNKFQQKLFCLSLCVSFFSLAIPYLKKNKKDKIEQFHESIDYLWENMDVPSDGMPLKERKTEQKKQDKEIDERLYKILDSIPNIKGSYYIDNQIQLKKTGLYWPLALNLQNMLACSLSTFHRSSSLDFSDVIECSLKSADYIDQQCLSIYGKTENYFEKQCRNNIELLERIKKVLNMTDNFRLTWESTLSPLVDISEIPDKKTKSLEMSMQIKNSSVPL